MARLATEVTEGVSLNIIYVAPTQLTQENVNYSSNGHGHWVLCVFYHDSNIITIYDSLQSSIHQQYL